MAKVKVVGEYELGRTLGEGTFAKVKFGRHAASGETVAVKVLDKQRIRKEDLTDAIKVEITTMKAARHPCVVDLKQVLATREKIRRQTAQQRNIE